MGLESSSGPSSPEDSFADLREVEVREAEVRETVEDNDGVKRRTGEFEPPEEISLSRLLNNIIVFEVRFFYPKERR
jgi:hypothetical protein